MRTKRVPVFLPNVNAWQVRLGILVWCGLVATIIFLSARAIADPSESRLVVGAGLLMGLVVGGAYGLIAAAKRGSFFVDNPAEIERTMNMRLGSAVATGLGLLILLVFRQLGADVQTLVESALGGIALAWTPIVLAGWLRFESKRRAGTQVRGGELSADR